MTFSTARASAGSALAAKASKVRGSIVLGNPRTVTTSAAVKFPSCIKVVVGVSIDEFCGAFRMTPSRTTPDELSTVLTSVIAIIEKFSWVDVKVKSPFTSDRVDGSFALKPEPSS